MLRLKTTLGIVFLFKTVVFASVDNNGTLEESFNGQTLVKLGRQMNKPMLTLIGMTILNLHKCEEWTTWTLCEAKTIGIFGIRKRSRRCTTDTLSKVNETMENDWSICEGGEEKPMSKNFTCPSDYSLTTNGFCIKLYTTSKSHPDADAQCQKDGGYLINIDSEEKYADVKEILKQGPADTWVGGRRKGSSVDWEFLYGQNNGFYKNHWYSSTYPNLNPCLCLESFRWFTTSCSSAFPYLCELI